MGKKMKLPFRMKPKEGTTVTGAPPWLWPTCVHNPKTHSFRSITANEANFKIVNSVYHDGDVSSREFITGEDSFFSVRSSFLVQPETVNNVDDEESVIQGFKSSRLFFEPGETSSIMESAKNNDFPYRDTVSILAMDSMDPFTDFSDSMAEMVETHGLRDWDCLEELLTCYLRVNSKNNYGYIVGAFVDLLIHLNLRTASTGNSHFQTVKDSANLATSTAIDELCSSSSTATQCSFTSRLSISASSTPSSSISPCLSPLEKVEIVEKYKHFTGV